MVSVDSSCRVVLVPCCGEVDDADADADAVGHALGCTVCCGCPPLPTPWSGMSWSSRSSAVASVVGSNGGPSGIGRCDEVAPVLRSPGESVCLSRRGVRSRGAETSFVDARLSSFLMGSVGPSDRGSDSGESSRDRDLDKSRCLTFSCSCFTGVCLGRCGGVISGSGMTISDDCFHVVV